MVWWTAVRTREARVQARGWLRSYGNVVGGRIAGERGREREGKDGESGDGVGGVGGRGGGGKGGQGRSERCGRSWETFEVRLMAVVTSGYGESGEGGRL